MSDYIASEIETDNMLDDDQGATVDDDIDLLISPWIEIVVIGFVITAMLFACLGAVYFFGWVV